MSNPYQAPGASSSVATSHEAETRIVFSGQKLLMYSIPGYFAALPFLVIANAFLEGTPGKPVVTPMFGIVFAAGLLGLAAAAFCAAAGIFRMGGVLFPGSTRLLYAIGVLVPVPLIGMVVMFVANSNANGYLKARGFEMGFLGAKRNVRVPVAATRQ